MGIENRQTSTRIREIFGAGFGIFCVLIGAVGCRSDLNAISTGSTVSGTGSGSSSSSSSTSPTSDAFKITLSSIDDTHVIKNYYLHSQASFSSSCAISPGTTSPNNDVYCYLDVAELDLYFNGVSLQFNSPPTMCDYTEVTPYAYWGLQPGSVATGASCTVLQNTATGAITQSCTATSHLSWNGAGYTCNYDYSATNGPNCCEGQYTLTNGTTDGTTTTWGTPTTVLAGGNMSNCFTGPGKDLSGYQTSKGYPRSVLYSTSGVGVNAKLDVPSPLSKQWATNLYVANYWNPKDFVRSGSETGTFPPTAGNVPLAFQTYSGIAAHPYYEFRCLDKAEDTIARIRVLVRSWDTVSNFTAQLNPYTDPSTHETGFNPDYYLQDRSAWADFAKTPQAGFGTPRFGDILPGMTL